MSQDVFDTDHLVKTYFKMSFPVVLGLVISLVYNLADTFFIAQTGNTTLVAGVSLCSPVFITLMAFGNIYGQGGSSLISRLLGQKDKSGVAHVSSFCFYAAILNGLVFGVLMLLFQMPLLTLLGADPDTLPYAREYYTVLAFGAPATILSYVHSNLLRCEGMAAQSMVGTVTGTVLNIILDPILIFGLHMGATGAAVATVLSSLVSDLIFLVVVLRRSVYLSVAPRNWKISAGDLRQIWGVGITAALTNLMQSLSIIVLNQFLLPYGNEKIAAMGIVLKVSMIAQLILTGFAFGGVPMYGYLYGAGNRRKLNELITFCLKFMGGLSLALTAILFVGAPTWMRLMMDAESIVTDGSVMLRWQVSSTIFAAVVLLITVLFQATGKVIPAFLMSVSRQGVVLIAVLLVAVNLFGYNGVILSQAIADVLSAVLAIALYCKVFLRREKPKKE